MIEQADTVCLCIGSHEEKIVLDVMELGRHPLILGIPWLKVHNPTIDWTSHRVTFASPFCSHQCLDQPCDVFGSHNGRPRFDSNSGPRTNDFKNKVTIDEVF